jgi:hypothetical protein
VSCGASSAANSLSQSSLVGAAKASSMTAKRSDGPPDTRPTDSNRPSDHVKTSTTYGIILAPDSASAAALPRSHPLPRTTRLVPLRPGGYAPITTSRLTY